MRAVWTTLALLAWCVAAQAAGERVVRVCAWDEPPLMAYDARTATITGIYGDILKAAAQVEGWKLEYVPGTMEDCLARLAAGQVDLMPNAADSEGRAGALSFNSEPVISAWGQVYARPGSSIETLHDLAGRRIAVVKPSVVQERIEQLIAELGLAVKIVAVTGHEQSLRSVAGGQADAAVLNAYTGAHYARRYGLVATDLVLPPFTLRFACRRGAHPNLLAAIDRALARLKSDPSSGYFLALQDTAQSTQVFTVPLWFRWAAASAVLVLILAIGWVITLRRAARRLAWSEHQQHRLATALTRVFDLSLDVIAVLDADYNVLRISHAAEAVLGYPPERVVGSSFLRWVADSPQDADRAAAQKALQSARDGSPVHGDRFALKHKDRPSTAMQWSMVWSGQQHEMYVIGRLAEPAAGK